MKKDHLWDAPHAYDCSETNYFAGSHETVTEHESWACFLEDEGASDLDFNLLFRWDWFKEEKTLFLYFMGQRKGIYRCVKVRGMVPDEEESVRAWLFKRWAHLHALWAPVSGMTVVVEKMR